MKITQLVGTEARIPDEVICHSLQEITPVSGSDVAVTEESERKPSERRLGHFWGAGG